MPSLLIPIYLYELVEFAGLSAPVDGLVFLAGFKFCAAWFRVFPWCYWLCLFLFYFNGEFDPGSG